MIAAVKNLLLAGQHAPGIYSLDSAGVILFQPLVTE